MSSQPTDRPVVPERFRVAKPTLLFDKFMNVFIAVGGISIIVAVSLIFFFILLQIFPLFGKAEVTGDRTVELDDKAFAVMGVDEWLELPFFMSMDGTLTFLDIGEEAGNRGLFTVDTGIENLTPLSSVSYSPRFSEVAVGTEDGNFSVISLNYRPTYPANRDREIVAEVSSLPLLDLGVAGHPLLSVSYGDATHGDDGRRKMAGGHQIIAGEPKVFAVLLDTPRTLFGIGEPQIVERFDLSDSLSGEPFKVLVTWEADSVMVGHTNGNVDLFFLSGGEMELRQTFQPFGHLDDPSIASMDFVVGDVTTIFTHSSGEMVGWSLYHDPETDQRIYGHSKDFPAMEKGAQFYSLSSRNKAFLTGHDNFVSLRYLTTENIRWEATLPYSVRQAMIAPRYNGLLLLTDENKLVLKNLKDPHPISSWKTYFGKIKYEGQSEATWTWQSTGGRDDFERKLSMIPLIIGTLKGTFYALIFAVPIALLAALYTSQFLKPSIKRIVKPVMEIMASLPSVVLGFLAALWLAPIVSNEVPAVFNMTVFIFLGAILFGYLWGLTPNKIRLKIKPGWEFLVALPLALFFGYLGWQFGSVFEQLFFTVTDPDTGIVIADFRLWYPEAIGLPFEQRNAFVVGFVMGFAVIPIIFTISEDSLSNVPEAFRSGSLALGASRWQTAIKIVLPTASAGIFSALMIGLGRAVGETMIVVMATGNVAVNSFNPFNGMRTLSANIAVELPEAPYLGTLYRTLFLGAMILFLMTFVVNTFAEILRQRLREKYRAVE